MDILIKVYIKTIEEHWSYSVLQINKLYKEIKKQTTPTQRKNMLINDIAMVRNR